MGLPSGHDLRVYPQPLPERGQTEQREPRYRGKTLLDDLVMAALPVAGAQLTTVEASFQGRPPVTYHGTPEEVAARAFDIAVAVLKERAKRLNPTTTPSAAV